MKKLLFLIPLSLFMVLPLGVGFLKDNLDHFETNTSLMMFIAAIVVIGGGGTLATGVWAVEQNDKNK